MSITAPPEFHSKDGRPGRGQERRSRYVVRHGGLDGFGMFINEPRPSLFAFLPWWANARRRSAP